MQGRSRPLIAHQVARGPEAPCLRPASAILREPRLCAPSGSSCRDLRSYAIAGTAPRLQGGPSSVTFPPAWRAAERATGSEPQAHSRAWVDWVPTAAAGGRVQQLSSMLRSLLAKVRALGARRRFQGLPTTAWMPMYRADGPWAEGRGARAGLGVGASAEGPPGRPGRPPDAPELAIALCRRRLPRRSRRAGHGGRSARRRWRRAPPAWRRPPPSR